MKNSRPYLLRALHEWIVDSQCSPYIIVEAQGEGIEVPVEFIEDGQIILNVSPSAVKDLIIGNEAVEFSARFKGISKTLYIPVNNIVAIYAKENGQGMVLGPADDMPPDDSPSTGGKKSKPNLRIVK